MAKQKKRKVSWQQVVLAVIAILMILSMIVSMVAFR